MNAAENLACFGAQNEIAKSVKAVLIGASPACRIRINEGKGSKDRMVLFGKSFATALRAYLAAHPKNRYLFQTRLAGPFTPRRVEQIVKRYAEAVGVKATPHTFRHQAISWLTRHSGMADAELQLITGHA